MTEKWIDIPVKGGSMAAFQAGSGKPGIVMLQEVSRVLFEEEGFRGNRMEYYDPRNSFLNNVIDRRMGIPITLSIVYLEVGWRLGIPLHGVNFPGHFLVRYAGEAVQLLVDPFQSGMVRFEDESQDLLDHVYGGSVRMQPDFLRAANRCDILVRLLSNLKATYLNRRDDTRALAAIERVLLVRPDSAPDVVQDELLRLVCPTAVDYGGGRMIQVVYQLWSIERKLNLRVKCELPLDALEIDTVYFLWRAADWLEREVYDMFGVVFDGHPDLRRILMPEDYEGHPQRRDFPIGGEPILFTIDEAEGTAYTQ